MCLVTMDLGLEHFLPSDNEPTQPVLGLPLPVGMAFTPHFPVSVRLFGLAYVYESHGT